MKTIKLLIAILFAAGLTNSRAQDTWTQKADFGGTAGHGAVGFSIGSKGYIGIGYDGQYKKDFWEYDPATNVWTQKANFGGIGRHVGVGFSIGSKGYIGTGAGISGEFKDFWEYDPLTNHWTQKADVGGLPTHGAVGFSIGNKGYIGTGHNTAGNVLKDFWEYDPLTDVWTKKADFGGIGRLYAVGFSIGNKGYIGTGNTNENVGTNLKDFWEYDPATDTWTQKTDFGGSARHASVGFSIVSKGYICAGEDTYVKNDFWEYDPATDVWTQKANFGGVPRSYAAGFSINDKGYIGTGLNELSGYTHYKDFWEYTPGETTCDPPTDLKVISTTDSSAEVGWTLSGSSSAGLIIHFHPAGSNAWRERIAKAGATHVLLKYLLPNTTYKWQIRSACSDKLSGWAKGPDFTTTSSAVFSSNTAFANGSKVQDNISMQIMPNPSNGNFNVQMQLPSKAASTTLELYNNLGVRVWQQDAGKLSGLVSRNINLESKLTAGVYVMIIRQGDTRLVQKVVVTK